MFFLSIFSIYVIDMSMLQAEIYHIRLDQKRPALSNREHVIKWA